MNDGSANDRARAMLAPDARQQLVAPGTNRRARETGRAFHDRDPAVAQRVRLGTGRHKRVSRSSITGLSTRIVRITASGSIMDAAADHTWGVLSIPRYSRLSAASMNLNNLFLHGTLASVAVREQPVGSRQIERCTHAAFGLEWLFELESCKPGRFRFLGQRC